MSDKPVFGRFMKPIHPFDLYELVRSQPQEKLLECKRVGVTGIPVMQEDGTCYLSNASILEFDGHLYLQTSTVKPVTKNIT